MKRERWNQIKAEFSLYWVGAVPGLIVIILVICARLTGSVQSLEWFTLDTFLRLRPSEPLDERIVIIGIDEEDITKLDYPIPDREIASLIKTLEKYQPRAIGLDLVRDLPVEPGHSELVEVFQSHPNLIGVDKIFEPKIAPPPDLPAQQIGFADYFTDLDGNVRRSLLGTIPPEEKQEYRFSFSLLLAKAYLKEEGIELNSGAQDPDAMQFGSTELPRFFDNSGGYVGTDNAHGVQVLLNFRNGKERFRVLSLEDIKTGNFEQNWLQDRLVLIGMTSSSVKDPVNTNAIAHLNPSGKIYGVEFHAQAISQILSKEKDGRPLLKTWSDGWEYLWIVAWGVIGISLGYLKKSPSTNLIVVVFCSLALISFSYLLLAECGWWIPVAPALLVLGINGISLTAFYQHDRLLRARIDEDKHIIEERQRTIENTFNLIHNGPLQTLKYVLRRVGDKDLSQEELLLNLQDINNKIREISEYLEQESITTEESILLGSGLKLDLKRPIHELFYEVYRSTLERTQEFPYFPNLKVKVRTFEPVDEQHLSFDQKQKICQFLEEALCNAGKHAQGMTRLTTTGKNQESWYILSIQDNGLKNTSNSEGRGTKQCKNLAKQLGGQFKREFLSGKGTLCELSWSLADNDRRLVKLKDQFKILFLK